MSWFGLTLVLAKLICGRIEDRIGGAGATLVIGCGALGTYLLCALAPLRTAVILACAMTLGGIGFSMHTMLLPVWARDFLGPEQYERGVETGTLAYTAGSCLINPIPGILADISGSYVPSYILFFVLTLICILLTERMYLKLRRAREAR